MWKACLVLPQMWKSQDGMKNSTFVEISLSLPLTRINLDQAKPSTFSRSICCCFQFHSRHRFFHTAGNFPVITFQTSITQLFPFLHFYCQIFSNKLLFRICVFMARLKLHHRQSLKFLFSNIHKLKNCFFCSWLMMMAFSLDRIVPRTNQQPVFWKITAENIRDRKQKRNNFSAG